MRRLAMTSCSDPLFPWADEHLPTLSSALAAAGYHLDARAVVNAAATQPAERWDPQLRADLLNAAYADEQAVGIVDISGGNLANEVLPYLDWPLISSHPKPLIGYSDLSCVLGAISARTGQHTVLWNLLAGLRRGFDPLNHVLNAVICRPDRVITEPGITAAEVLRLPWTGGNLRCFLKLAGTPYWPDVTGSVFLIESLGPSLRSIVGYLAQHSQAGTFHKVRAVAVGQLTRIDEAGQRATALEIIRHYAPGIPVVEVPDVGHSPDCAAVTLGTGIPSHP
ncbi:LD-carboxypeptidase [Actinobaculum sp. 352]|uniref:LD-carboxypeptidase n=1 Tax=Actinobaculum sp. 352 TaxID=2490946 RepID=UPI000F7E9947|nr:LD-carboxypeptidase [Actinobaculum sp. 352]RTE50760.1 hypothetical protein EKN07_01050 [Actinobaculum sp. 352]